MTQALTKRTFKKKRTRMGFGTNGWRTLKLAYQVGGFTAFQHARFFGVPVQKSYRILSSLSTQKLMEQAPVQTLGRPRDFNYLSKANASRGILLGGYEADVRQHEVLAGYKRFQLPEAVEHRHSLNQYLLSLREAAAEDPDIEVPLEFLWGESNSAFPLRGEAQKSDHTSARMSYEKTYPDGILTARFGEDLSARYYLEYESRSRPGHVLEKIDSYGAHFRRLLKEDGDNVRDWLRPLLFLFPRNSTMKHLSFAATGAVRADAPELKRYLAWRRAAQKKGIHAGRLVMFSSLEDINLRGAFASKSSVLDKYPDGAPGADLRGAARELSETVTRVVGGGSR